MASRSGQRHVCKLLLRSRTVTSTHRGSCPRGRRIRLERTTVGVEKGTKAVISANSSAYGELEFNNLRANFFAEIPQKSFSTATPVYDIYRIESFATLTRSGLHHQPSDSDSVEEEWVFSNLASLFLLRPCGAVAQDNSRYRFRRWRVAGLPDNRRALLRRRGSLRRARGMRCLRPRWRP